jgi:ATP-dependent Clp protease ATP-binding subunit ClpC
MRASTRWRSEARSSRTTSDDRAEIFLETLSLCVFRRSSDFAFRFLPFSQARGALVVTAVFEKFTERAIKAVMLAQQEAKALKRPEVGPEHILMGLVAEEAKKGGYLGSGMTIESAREKAREISSVRRERRR